MQALGQFTDPRLIVPELRSGDAAGVVGELCTVLQREGAVSDVLPFHNAVADREALGNTAIAPCLALPHARLPGLPRLCFALGRARDPLVWFGGKPVRLVFLFAVPEKGAATYLTLMSGLARLSKDAPRLNGLLEVADARTMVELLEQIPLRTPRPAPVAA